MTKKIKVKRPDMWKKSNWFEKMGAVSTPMMLGVGVGDKIGGMAGAMSGAGLGVIGGAALLAGAKMVSIRKETEKAADEAAYQAGKKAGENAQILIKHLKAKKAKKY